MTLRTQIPAEKTEAKQGCLYVVATPIGNLADITHRAVEILQAVDWVAAEDTRHTKTLLSALGLQQNLLSLHEHNEQQRAQQLLQRLQNGEQGALVSDAGTPLINDPGYHLVKLLRDHDIAVVPVPGVSAVITALSCAGLPTDRFTYEGFLPAKNSKRLQALEQLQAETRTLVFYESPHRLLDSLSSMLQVFGSEREIVVGRELTKKFEQFVSGTLAEVHDYFLTNPERVRGEFVVMLAGFKQVTDEPAATAVETEQMIKVMLEHGLPVKQLAEIIAELSGEKKKAIYNRALQIKAQ